MIASRLSVDCASYRNKNKKKREKRRLFCRDQRSANGNGDNDEDDNVNAIFFISCSTSVTQQWRFFQWCLKILEVLH